MSPLRPLPVPSMEHTVQVSGDLVVAVKGGGTARLAVGEGTPNPAVAAAAATVRAMSAARVGQPPESRAARPSELLEQAGRQHFLDEIAPTEGLPAGSVAPKGQPVRTPWSDPNSRRTSGRAGLGDTVPDVGWGERQNAAGQLDLISIPEVSMVG